MTVEEFKTILNDEQMQTKQTNIQVYKNGKNKITLKEFYDQFLEFIQEQRKFNQYVLDVFKRNNLK